MAIECQRKDADKAARAFVDHAQGVNFRQVQLDSLQKPQMIWIGSTAGSLLFIYTSLHPHLVVCSSRVHCSYVTLPLVHRQTMQRHPLAGTDRKRLTRVHSPIEASKSPNPRDHQLKNVPLRAGLPH